MPINTDIEKGMFPKRNQSICNTQTTKYKELKNMIKPLRPSDSTIKFLQK